MSKGRYEALAMEVTRALSDAGIVADVYDTDCSVKVEIYWGDWKHEHLAAKWIANEVFKKHGYEMEHVEMLLEEDGSDCYSALHEFIPCPEKFDFN